MKSLGMYMVVVATVFLSVVGYGQSDYPYLKTPIADAVIDTREVEVVFRWNETQNGNYVLEIADNDGFSGMETYATTDLSMTLARNVLPESGFWRVRSGGSVTSVRAFEQLDLAALDNLVYHIDANEGVEVSGDRVVRWNNLAQDAFHAQQPIANDRPALISNQINNNSVIRFGTETTSIFQSLNLSDFSVEGSGLTFISLYTDLSHSPSLSYFLGRTSPNAGVYSGGLRNNGPSRGFAVTNGAPNFIRVLSLMPLNWTISSCIPDKIFVNKEVVSDIEGDGIDRIQFNTIGGRPDVPTINFHGDLAEIIIFDRTLPDEERLKIENYLSTKYTPYPNLGNDISLCTPSTKIGIKPDPIYSSISWSSGEEDMDSITVTNNGWYWVEATALGRTYRDSVYVRGLVPKPELSEVGEKTICLGETLNLTALNAAPDGVNYQWSDGSSDASLPVTEAGTYSLTYVDDSGCAVGSESLTVSVNDFPATEGLGPDRTVCRNTNIYFDNMDRGQAPYTYAWQGGGTEPFRTASSTGSQTFTIAVTDAMGCVANDEVELNVTSTLAPEVAFEYDTVCPMTTTNLRGTTTPSGGDPLSSETWNIMGTNLQGNSVDYTPTTMDPYPVVHIVQSQGGCSNVLIDTVRLLPQPIVEYQATGACAESPYQFVAGQLTPEQMVNWQWYFEAPSTAPETQQNGPVGQYVFENPGVYNVSLVGTDINGCSDSLTQSIEVAPVPQASFEFQEQCAGGVVSFENTTSLPAPYTIQSQTWQFGDGTSSGQVSPSKPYFMHGEYTVTLSVTSSNGCVNSTSRPLKVHAIPQPDFYVDANCAGVPTLFSDSSFVPNGSVAEVFWDFGDGNEGEGFTTSHRYAQEGTFEVTQRVRSSFGCQETKKQTIALSDFLQTDFTLSPFALLVDYPTNYVDLSQGVTDYWWDFGGVFQSYEASPSFVFDETYLGDTITIQLTGSNAQGCTDDKTLTFVVRRESTDLAVRQLFIQENDGFYIIGVELENRGATPIAQADLKLRTTNVPVIREQWEGLLEAGEREIHVFTAQPPMTQDQQAQPDDYVCVEALLVSEFGFTDEDFSNNELCRHLTEESPILLLPYPNPTAGELTLRVILPEATTASLRIYDAAGQMVNEVAADEPFKKGVNRFLVDMTHLAQGVYSVVFVTESGERRSVLVVKS